MQWLLMINGGIDLVMRLIEMYNTQSDKDVDLALKLEEVKMSLNDTKQKVLEYMPKDV